MPDRNDIIEEIRFSKNHGQDFVRRKYLHELNEFTNIDTIVYAAGNAKPGMPADAFSIVKEDISGFMTCLSRLVGEKLDLIIHSGGGSIDVTEQLVHYLRNKYKYIRAIIPQYAMSAATMLACACDEIVMSKAAAIGPIDPQVTITRRNGSTCMVPAHTVLADFNMAKEEIKADPKTAMTWIPKLLDIPNGYLDLCAKSIARSKSIVGEWLDRYMFVESEEKKGQEIAEWLGDFNQHKTHAKPIGYDTAKEKRLKVSLLEEDQILQDKVLSVFHSTMVTFEITSCVKLIENHLGKGTYIQLTQIQTWNYV